MARPSVKQDLIEYFIASLTLDLKGLGHAHPSTDPYPFGFETFALWAEGLSEAGRLLGLAVYDKVFKRRRAQLEYDAYATSERMADAIEKYYDVQGYFPHYGALAVMAKDAVTLEG